MKKELREEIHSNNGTDDDKYCTVQISLHIHLPSIDWHKAKFAKMSKMLRKNGRDCPNEDCKYNNPMDAKTCLVCHTTQNMEIFNCGQCTLANEMKYPKCLCKGDKPTRTTADVLAEVVKDEPPPKKQKTEKKPTPYNLFVKQKYPLLKKQEPTKDMSELSKQLATIWNKLKPEDKEKYGAGKNEAGKSEGGKSEAESPLKPDKKLDIPAPVPASPVAPYGSASSPAQKIDPKKLESNQKKVEKLTEENKKLLEKTAKMKAKIDELKKELEAKKNEKALEKINKKMDKAETKKKEDQMREVLSQGVWMNIEEKDIDEHLTFLGLPTDGEKSHKRCRLLGAIERQQTYKDGKLTSERLAKLCGQLKLSKAGDYAARRNTILTHV
eukprot:g12838.t1